MKEKAARLLDFLFPRKCPFCGKIQEEEQPCPHCLKELPWLVGQEGEERLDFVKRSACALRYQGTVAEAIRRVKFGRRAAALKSMGSLTGQCARDHFGKVHFDFVTWVPLSPRELRHRGFDQAEMLARQVAAIMDVPLASLLAKKNGVPTQSSMKSDAARRANVMGVFRLAEKRPELAGSRVLLVDDVITSGSTASECARLLRAGGVREVYVVGLARAGLGASPVRGRDR